MPDPVGQSATKSSVGGWLEEFKGGNCLSEISKKCNNLEAVELVPRSVVFITTARCIEWPRRKMTRGEMDT